MQRRGFTLIELLVVVTIILLVSVVTLPAVVNGLGDRTLLSSAQALQGALVAARDGAKLDNAPRGLRFMPDPANPATLNRIVPLVTGGSYSEGLVYVPTGYVPPVPCLTLVERVTDAAGQPISRTAFAWNARIGDRLKIGFDTYTICGPMMTPNADGFVNYRDPATGLDSTPFFIIVGTTTVYFDYLQLVNGRDDNHDGFVDNGFDGLDNDLINGIDDPGEWEVETWVKPVPDFSPYTIYRRPVPGGGSQTTLSVPVLTAASTLMPNPITGVVELMIQPNGTVDLSGPYASSSAVSLGQAKSVFVLDANAAPSIPLDPNDSIRSVTLWTRTGMVESN